jgi:hypothetical protein
MKVKSIQETLPVLGFDGDILLSANLDMSIGLQLQLPELLTCREERERTHQTTTVIQHSFIGFLEAFSSS